MKKSDEWEYPPIPGDGRFMVLLAYATFATRRDLKHRGILDQLYAIAAGWA